MPPPLRTESTAAMVPVVHPENIVARCLGFVCYGEIAPLTSLCDRSARSFSFLVLLAPGDIRRIVYNVHSGSVVVVEVVVVDFHMRNRSININRAGLSIPARVSAAKRVCVCVL